jgi:hypothetical protein
MAGMLRSAAVLLVLAGLLASTAAAATGEPRKRHTIEGSAAAQRPLIRKSDLKGWKSAESKPAGASKACDGLRPNLSNLTETGYAEAPDFNLGQLSSVSQSVRVFKTADAAAAAYARTVTIGLVACVAKELEAASNKTATIKATGQFRLPVPQVTAKTAGFRVVAAAKTDHESFKVYADIVVIQRGDTITTVTFTGFTAPVDTALEERLVRTIGQRLGATPTAA